MPLPAAMMVSAAMIGRLAHRKNGCPPHREQMDKRSVAGHGFGAPPRRPGGLTTSCPPHEMWRVAAAQPSCPGPRARPAQLWPAAAPPRFEPLRHRGDWQPRWRGSTTNASQQTIGLRCPRLPPRLPPPLHPYFPCLPPLRCVPLLVGRPAACPPQSLRACSGPARCPPLVLLCGLLGRPWIGLCVPRMPLVPPVCS